MPADPAEDKLPTSTFLKPPVESATYFAKMYAYPYQSRPRPALLLERFARQVRRQVAPDAARSELQSKVESLTT
jgi:hypothetical protein